MDLVEEATKLLLPVLESSVILAAHYCKQCGRSTITATDMEYAMKFAARNVLGTITESMFPEIYEESESGSDIEESEEEEFTRFSGDDSWCIRMNEAVDTWDAWEPESPAQRMLKNAIERRTEGR